VAATQPEPDARGEAAAREILDLASTLKEDDVALVLVSGGASALTSCPAPGLTLADLAATTSALLRSGADIREMNCVRKHLSALHGGRLALALGRARSVTLLVSDVVGDDLSAIGSGPTAPDPTTFAEALDVLSRRVGGGGVPAAVRETLERGARGDEEETPDTEALDWSRHVHEVVASAALAVAAAESVLAQDGFAVRSLGSAIEGDASELAVTLVDRLLAESSRARRVALVGAGETTVVVGGPGLGGRNQHLACVAARELASRGAGPAVVAAIATDGTDGPTDAAGGLVDSRTWERARRAGADPDALLARFDSATLLRAAGDQVVTGPTGTNVMDLYLGLATPPTDGAARP
jgi:glycerate-2-kinase